MEWWFQDAEGLWEKIKEKQGTNKWRQSMRILRGMYSTERLPKSCRGRGSFSYFHSPVILISCCGCCCSMACPRVPPHAQP